MKKRTIFLLIIVLVWVSVSLTSLLTILASPDLTCTVKLSCDPSEEPVFGMWDIVNSHAGDSGYGNYKVCCQDSTATLHSVIKTDACNPSLNEGGVLSLYKTSNSHAKEYSSTDLLYHVCLNSTRGPIECSYKGSCDTAAGEVCLASLNQNDNSHVANCSEYSIKICCYYGAFCGDGTIGPGETCDPPNIVNSMNCSQTTSYCNYTTRQYCTRDEYGDCNPVCQCVNDTGSCGAADNPDYCNNCNHCGDGTINCGEGCEPPGAMDDDDCACPADGCYDYDGDGDVPDLIDYPDYGDCNSTCGCDVGEGLGEPCFPDNIWEDNITFCGCSVDTDCQPGEKCNTTSGVCYDFRPECTGCKYYDWCESGMEPGNPLKSCCANKTNPSQVLPCCLLGASQEMNCSKPGAVYNYLEVNATYDYCFNADCDITGRCIDGNYTAHEMFQRC